MLVLTIFLLASPFKPVKVGPTMKQSYRAILEIARRREKEREREEHANDSGKGLSGIM